VGLTGLMRIRIIQQPAIASIDGVRLDCFELGKEYELGTSLGGVFLAEGWADLVALDGGPSPDDVFQEFRLSPPEGPANLVREPHPFHLDRDVAADLRWRFRRRHRDKT
jgi:hypothetical protein